MKYNNGIFIGKFYPLHFGHISAVKALCLSCENVYVLFYCNKKDEEKLHKSSGYKYDIEKRVEDCKNIFKEKNVHVFKLEVDDDRKFPDNRESILKKIKAIVNNSLDLQIFGCEEYEIYAPYRYADEFMVASPYTVEDEKGELVFLHATLIRNEYDYYKSHIPTIIKNRIDALKKDSVIE